MNAAFRWEMTAGERKGFGLAAFAAGAFFAVTSVLVTLSLAVWALLDPDFEYVDPIWAWLAVTAVLSAAASVLGADAARRGRRAAREPETRVRYAVALFFATVIWLAWSFAASVYFVAFAFFVVALAGTAALVCLVLGRLVMAARALLDSRR